MPSEVAAWLAARMDSLARREASARGALEALSDSTRSRMRSASWRSHRGSSRTCPSFPSPSTSRGSPAGARTTMTRDSRRRSTRGDSTTCFGSRPRRKAASRRRCCATPPGRGRSRSSPASWASRARATRIRARSWRSSRRSCSASCSATSSRASWWRSPATRSATGSRRCASSWPAARSRSSSGSRSAASWRARTCCPRSGSGRSSSRCWCWARRSRSAPSCSRRGCS